MPATARLTGRTRYRLTLFQNNLILQLEYVEAVEPDFADPYDVAPTRTGWRDAKPTDMPPGTLHVAGALDGSPRHLVLPESVMSAPTSDPQA